MSRIKLPKIGTILRRNNNGSYEQGPIPGLAGPFESAAEFFKVWAANTEFGLLEDRLREAAGSLADELLSSTSYFKALVGSLAGRLSVQDRGPFLLSYGDFVYNNIIFDDNY